MKPTFLIDCITDEVDIPHEGIARVAIDVIRATTTAMTAVARGRRCFPVPTLDAALSLSRRLSNPLLGGELGGNVPYHFDMNNSPVEADRRTDTWRPLVLLSSSGTRLMWEIGKHSSAYVACLRNMSAVADYLAARHDRVALLGAGTRGEFREEDQYCASLIGQQLMDQGFVPEDAETAMYLSRWSGKPADAILGSKSVGYLDETDQRHDLDFILEHVDDLNDPFLVHQGEVVRVVRPISSTPTTPDAMPFYDPQMKGRSS